MFQLFAILANGQTRWLGESATHEAAARALRLAAERNGGTASSKALEGYAQLYVVQTEEFLNLEARK